MDIVIRILKFWLIICLIKATSARILKWDSPRNGNARAFKRLPENTRSVTEIQKVRAFPEMYTRHSKLYYSILSQDGSTATAGFAFTLDNDVLRTAPRATFDYEKHTEYVLVIRVREILFGRGRSGSSSATVTVSIEDLNDNAPEFPKSHSYVFYVDENAEKSTFVTTVTATDKDGSIQNNIVRYDIVGGDDQKHFTIEPNSGIITTTGQSWNKALKSTYILKVVAVDNGNPRLTGTTDVIVHLRFLSGGENGKKGASARIQGWETPQDGNAAAPKTLPEDSHNVTEVMKVKAITGADTILSYQIVSQDGSTAATGFAFDFNSNSLQTKAHAKFDYEKHTEYVLIISASDNRSSETGENTATVTVSIEDLNDKTPEFPKSPTYVSYIDEDAKEGTFVIAVTAIDKDATRKNNRIVGYEIEGGDYHGHFTIDPKSGRITKTGRPWNKSLKDTYFLQVIAFDSGSPRLTGTTTVVVHLGFPQGVNDKQNVNGKLSILTISIFFSVYLHL